MKGNVRAAGRGAAATLTLLVAAGAIASLAGGCTVGDGNGSAIGPIFFLGCTSDSNYGVPGNERIFDLSPHFFAAEPIEDIAVALPANRLLIRMQRNGNRLEVNDVLFFDVQNAFEVARCVRGRTVGGVPDYDYMRMVADPLTRLPTTTPWCDWSGGGSVTAGDGGVVDGGVIDAGTGPVIPPHARIHIGVEEIVRANLSLLFTCHKANVIGLAFDGWIDFQDFGGAAQPDLPPERRDMIDRDFKVNFGDRLRATFSIGIGDQRVVFAIRELLPIPQPLIGGQLVGSFDFDLERGRAAQPFP